MAEKAAEESARYAAMSEIERAEYDLETVAMMPRLRGAREMRERALAVLERERALERAVPSDLAGARRGRVVKG